jgi:hypothetical protein
MSTPHENVPPHYHALRVLWTVLQVAVLLIVIGLVVQAVPPGELIGDINDWARDL